MHPAATTSAADGPSGSSAELGPDDPDDARPVVEPAPPPASGSPAAGESSSLLWVGGTLVVVGAILAAYVTVRLSGLETPQAFSGNAGADQAAREVAAFGQRISETLKLQAVALGALAAGIAPTLGGAILTRPSLVATKATIPLSFIGLASGLIVGLGRWRALGFPQFSEGWGRWVAAEGLGWLGVALTTGGLVGLALIGGAPGLRAIGTSATEDDEKHEEEEAWDETEETVADEERPGGPAGPT